MNQYLNLSVNEAFTAITEILSMHCSKLKLNSAVNLQNLNVLSERVVEILLNHLYDYQLINANKVIANNPGCDLVDYKNRIVVSVSSEKTKRKIERDIASSSIQFTGYRFIYFCLTDEKNGLKKKEYKTENMLFNPNKDILDFKSIMEDILHNKEIKTLLLLLVDELSVPGSLSHHRPEIYLEIYQKDFIRNSDKKLLDNARLYLAKKDYKSALSLINLMNDFSREALILKAGVEGQILHEYDPIKTISLILDDNPKDIEALKLKAKYLIDKGDAFSAKKIYENIYEIDNRNPYWIFSAYYAEAIFYQNKGKIKKSINCFESALTYFSNTKTIIEATICYEIALAHIKLYPDSDLDRALGCIDISIEIAKNSESDKLLIDCYLNKVKCFRKMKKHSEAKSILLDADMLCSTSTSSKVYLDAEWGNYYLSTGDIKSAEKYLDKVISAIENSNLHELKSTSISQRALCYVLRQDYISAIKQFKKSAAINKENRFFFLLFRNHLDLARCYRMIKGNEQNVNFHTSEATKLMSKYFPDFNLNKL